MQALAVLAETDLIAAMPQRIVERRAKRFGLGFVEAPLVLPRSRIRAIVLEPAIMDAGLVWLLHMLVDTSPAANRKLKSRLRWLATGIAACR
jgi:hypothetical protein